MFAFPLPKSFSAHPSTSSSNNKPQPKKPSSKPVVSKQQHHQQKSQSSLPVAQRRKRDVTDVFAGLDSLFSKPRPHFLDESEEDNDEDDEEKQQKQEQLIQQQQKPNHVPPNTANNNNHVNKNISLKPSSNSLFVKNNVLDKGFVVNRDQSRSYFADSSSTSSFDFGDDSFVPNHNNNTNNKNSGGNNININTTSFLSDVSSSSHASELALFQRKREDAVERFVFDAKLLEGALSSISTSSCVSSSSSPTHNNTASSSFEPLSPTSPQMNNNSVSSSSSSLSQTLFPVVGNDSQQQHQRLSLQLTSTSTSSSIIRVLNLLSELLTQLHEERNLLRWAHRAGSGKTLVDAISNALSKFSSRWMQEVFLMNRRGNSVLDDDGAPRMLRSASIAFRLAIVALVVSISSAIPVAPATSTGFFNTCLLILSNFDCTSNKDNGESICSMNNNNSDFQQEMSQRQSMNSSASNSQQQSQIKTSSQGFASLLSSRSSKQQQQQLSQSNSQEQQKQMKQVREGKNKKNIKNARSSKDEDEDEDEEDLPNNKKLQQQQQQLDFLVSDIVNLAVSIISHHNETKSEEWNDDEMKQLFTRLVSNRQSSSSSFDGEDDTIAVFEEHEDSSSSSSSVDIKIFSCLGARALTQALLSCNLESYNNSASSGGMMQQQQTNDFDDNNKNNNNNMRTPSLRRNRNNRNGQFLKSDENFMNFGGDNDHDEDDNNDNDSASRRRKSSIATTSLFFNQQGWIRLSRVFSEGAAAALASSSSSWSSTSSLSWDPAIHCLTLLELVVSDPAAVTTIEMHWTKMEFGITSCVRSLLQLLRSDVESLTAMTKKVNMIVAQKQKQQSQHEPAQSRLQKRIEAVLRCIMNTSRVAPVAFSRFMNSDEDFKMIRDSFALGLEQLFEMDNHDAPRDSAVDGDEDRNEFFAIDLFSLTACAATALLMPPRASTSAARGIEVHDGLRRMFLGLSNNNQAQVIREINNDDDDDDEDDEMDLGSFLKSSAMNPHENDEIQKSSNKSLALVAANAMFHLRHGRTEAARNVAAAYAASFLVALSLNNNKDNSNSPNNFSRHSSRLHHHHPQNEGDPRVSVLQSIVAAATSHKATSQLGASPMAYPVAVLQEFILFQSSHRLLTKESLVGLHFLIEKAVVQNKIEQHVHDNSNESDDDEEDEDETLGSFLR